MAAITGTIAQSKDVYISGTINQLWGCVANAAESIVWAVDYARGEIQKVTGIGSTLANTLLTTGLTNPVAIALAAGELTLYVLQENGLMFSVNAATGVATQIGTMAALDTAWRYMKKGADGLLYCMDSNLKAIYRYDPASNTASLFHYLPYWVNGIDFSPDGVYLYYFIASGGPNTQSVLLRTVLAQGRWEVVAGTGAAAATSGENYLVSSFVASGDVAIDSTGTIIYAGDDLFANGRLCTITGGSVSRINVGANGTVKGGSQPRMWMLRSANKLVYTNGSTQIFVLT